MLDRGQGAQKWAATQPLDAAGVQLFKNKPGTGVRKVHHKLMVIDDRLVIVGSFNYTEPATTLNDENIVVIGDLEETDPDRASRPAAARRVSPAPRSTASSPTSPSPSDPRWTYAEGAAHDRAEGDHAVNPAACRFRTSEAVPTQLACSSPRRWRRRDVTIGTWQEMCWVASWRAAVATR